MKTFTRKFSRVGLNVVAGGALLLGSIPGLVLPLASTAQAQAQSRNLGPNGIPVSGRFLQEWTRQGSDTASLYVNGWPITRVRPEISLTDGKTYNTQWFERARYEAHPENKAPYDLQLGLLGVSLAEGRGSIDPATGKARNAADQPFVGIDKPADANGSTKVWFQETRHSVSGKILEYWDKYGGLKQFGFPLSEQFSEVSPTDGKTYTVQYFERNRFELHPEHADPYAVELGLLGVQQYKSQPIAADSLPIAPTKGTTSSKDTVVVAQGQEPASLDGFTDPSLTAVRHLDPVNFNNALVARDDRQNWFPLLVWYVPTLENGGSYYVGTGDDRHLVTKYKLRQGIKWADGKEITSNDVVFGYQYIMNPLTPVVTRTLQQKISTIDNPDKYTVLFNWLSVNQAKAILDNPKTDKTQYDFLKTFVSLHRPVVDPSYLLVGGAFPAHVLSKIPPDKIDQSDYAQSPLGYGPYKVTKWDHGVQMVYERNDNYNLTALPPIKRIVVKFITDVNQSYAQILTGDVDVVAKEPLVVPPDQIDQMKAAGITVDAIPAASFEHLDFNFSYAPFNDIRVRQAIAHAVNRKRIADTVFKGFAALTNTVVPPAVFHSLENPNFAKDFPDVAAKYKVPTYDYNVAEANQLLDQAGWTRGSDGIRQKNGVKLSFIYGSTINATRQRIQALVQSDLKAIGVDAQIKSYPTGQFFAGLNGGIIADGVCKLCMFAWIQSSTNDFSVWDKTQIPTQANPNLQNTQRYSSDATTQANQLYGSTVDAHETALYSAQAQVAIMDDVPILPLVVRPNIELFRNNLMNHKTTDSSVSMFWNVGQWYFK